MSEKFNLSIDQGATYAQQFQLLTGTGDPFNLTGYSIGSDLRVAYADVTASGVFDASLISPYTSGTIQLALSPTASLGLSQKCYVYDVLLTTGSITIRPIQGKAVVHPVVTR